MHACLVEWWLAGYRQPSVDKDLWILYQGVNPAEHPLSIRSLYVLLVVVLSAWVLGAALRLSAELAG